MTSPNENRLAGAEDVLGFWFADAPSDPAALETRNRVWFQGGDAFDRECRERFDATLEAAVRGELDHWKETARGRLALIILLDQFSRNVYRGTAAAFAQDEAALALCKEGIEIGQDRELEPCERTFFYMPLEHAENSEDQALCVRRFREIAADAPEPWREILERNVDYANQHKEIVDRFGRFPHRNAILGRDSTPDEQAYLDDDAPRFGQ